MHLCHELSHQDAEHSALVIRELIIGPGSGS